VIIALLTCIYCVSDEQEQLCIPERIIFPLRCCHTFASGIHLNFQRPEDRVCEAPVMRNLLFVMCGMARLKKLIRCRRGYTAPSRSIFSFTFSFLGPYFALTAAVCGFYYVQKISLSRYRMQRILSIGNRRQASDNLRNFELSFSLSLSFSSLLSLSLAGNVYRISN